jgi:hypothetical protein
VLRGGAGNDTLTVADLNFRIADGESGDDKLVLLGSGQTFDFRSLPDNRTAGIETIDFTGSGNNTLKLGAHDAFNFSTSASSGFSAAHSANALVLEGNSGDVLQLFGEGPGLASWQLQNSNVSLNGAAGGNYDIYDLVRGGANHVASIAVHNGVDVLLF